MNFEKTVSQYSLFRNDNWFNVLKYSFYYQDTNPSGTRSLSKIDKNIVF